MALNRPRSGGPYEYILWKRGAGAHFGENGLSFNAQTRELSGTPEAEGTHLPAYQVGDGNRARSDSFVEETYLQIVVAAAAVTGDTGPGPQRSPQINRAPGFDANLDTTLWASSHTTSTELWNGVSVGAYRKLSRISGAGVRTPCWCHSRMVG